MRTCSAVLLALVFLVSPAAFAQNNLTTVDGLNAEILKLIDAAKGSADPEVVAACGVLSALRGALLTERTQVFLDDAVGPFAKQELKRLKDKKSKNAPKAVPKVERDGKYL